MGMHNYDDDVYDQLEVLEPPHGDSQVKDSEQE